MIVQPDYRSSWEPAENFTDNDTIAEWKRDLANGDTLSTEEVDAVQARMDAYVEKRKKIEGKRERKQLRKK